MIYLDYNATTPIATEVKKAIIESLDIYGNPSSSHLVGVSARRIIETSRQMVAQMIGASQEEIIFTSGGTESNNLALFGMVSQYTKGHIISSAIEHPSIKAPLQELKRRGFEVTFIKPGRDGIINPEDVRNAITKKTLLITIMHANNETGTIQPVAEIAEIARQRGIVLHTDAAQSIGKIPVKVDDLGVDLLTIVSHKFYGPKGIGALYIRKGTRLSPMLFGASHERGIRPGTENTPLIAGIGRAAELTISELPDRQIRLRYLTDLLLGHLRGYLPDLVLNGSQDKKLPNTLNLTIPGIKGHELVEALKEEVAISAGSACHAGKVHASEVLLSMGVEKKDAVSSVRISTGRENTEDEIKEAAEIIAEKVKALRKRRGIRRFLPF